MVSAGAVAQGQLGDLGVELLDLGGRQDRNVPVGVRSREKHIPIDVGRAPCRWDRQAALVVEGVPEKTCEKCFAGMRQGCAGAGLAPQYPISTHFNPHRSRQSAGKRRVFQSAVVRPKTCGISK